MTKRLILASASPRRSELLQQVGVKFAVSPANVDETLLENESPTDYVMRLSCLKARTAYEQMQDEQVVALGSDTSVIVDDFVLGKPDGQEDAARMLRLLSGRTHRVITGVALVGLDYQKTTLVSTEVSMAPLTDQKIDKYWSTKEPVGKAGAYAIQGYGAAFVTHIHGSYTGVVGLPLAETIDLLAQVGIECWQQ